MFRIATGTQMTHDAYKGGAGPAVIGLLGNEVQMMFVTFSSVVSFAKQGRLRMLGVISPERNPALPEIPTMREQGLRHGESAPGRASSCRRARREPVVNKLLSRRHAHDEGPARW